MIWHEKQGGRKTTGPRQRKQGLRAWSRDRHFVGISHACRWPRDCWPDTWMHRQCSGSVATSKDRRARMMIGNSMAWCWCHLVRAASVRIVPGTHSIRLVARNSCSEHWPATVWSAPSIAAKKRCSFPATASRQVKESMKALHGDHRISVAFSSIPLPPNELQSGPGWPENRGLVQSFSPETAGAVNVPTANWMNRRWAPA